MNLSSEAALIITIIDNRHFVNLVFQSLFCQERAH
jgi:hypothetical protein